MTSPLSLLKFLCLLVLMVAAGTVAHATEDRGVEWRLLGPAFARHANNSGPDVPITAATRGVLTDCKIVGDLYPCTQRVVHSRAWSNTNPAIGLERSAPSFEGSTTRYRVFATLVRDSYGKMGLMAGAGRAWPVASLGTLSLEAGIAGGLWYRTVSDGVASTGEKVKFCYENDKYYGSSCLLSTSDAEVTVLKRRIVPFILPMLTLTERTSGLGLNIGLAPKIKIGRYSSVPTTTLMMQITYKLNF